MNTIKISGANAVIGMLLSFIQSKRMEHTRLPLASQLFRLKTSVGDVPFHESCVLIGIYENLVLILEGIVSAVVEQPSISDVSGLLPVEKRDD